MTILDTFVTDAVRTESPAFHPVSRDVIQTVLLDFIEAANRMDRLKKALFYGKDIENFRSTSTTNQLEPTDRVRRLTHAVIGIGTEAGELAEALHAHIFEGKDLDAVNFKEELGDAAWYQAIALSELGFTLEDTLETVIAKLKARFPDKFTSDRAIHRDLFGERQVLERVLHAH
jgi:NTP pyrophosphatase (non-canonical NTP hydrolase)